MYFFDHPVVLKSNENYFMDKTLLISDFLLTFCGNRNIQTKKKKKCADGKFLKF